jgi:hypothetical protein
MKVRLQYQNIFGKWQNYTTMHNEASAYRTASSKARQDGRRWRLVDDDGHLLDLISP